MTEKTYFEPEALKETDLPEAVLWDEVVDKPTTLAELSPTDGDRLTTVEEEVVNGFEDISIQGWTYDGAWSASSNTVVAWASGTLRFKDGNTYSITGATTGTMSSLTYIYFDLVTPTVLQHTTTAANAVGPNKLLMGVAQNVASGKKAIFQAFGGSGGVGVLLTADNIAANSITANEIQTNTITSLTLTSGTITGALIRTSSSGSRVELDDGDDALNVYDSSGELRITLDTDEITFYNSSGAERGGLYADTTNLYFHALNGGNIWIEAEGSSYGVYIFNDGTQIAVFGTNGLSMNNKRVDGIHRIGLNARTTNSTTTGDLWYYNNSGEGLRFRIAGFTLQFQADIV